MSEVFERRIDVDGADIFYRETGPKDAPVLLMPHGYPGSSYAYRTLLPLLGDTFRVLAPDFPGSGQSPLAEAFSYDFDGYADFLGRFADRVDAQQFLLYAHDVGGYIALRLAIFEPQRVRGFIFQNTDLFEDTFGPKYAALKETWEHPSPENHQKVLASVTAEHFKDEFLNGMSPEQAASMSPELWERHWAIVDEPRKRIAGELIWSLEKNRSWFPRYQEYLSQQKPPALVVFGKNDGYAGEAAAQSFSRVLPDARIELFDSGRWLLETHAQEVAALINEFGKKLQP